MSKQKEYGSGEVMGVLQETTRRRLAPSISTPEDQIMQEESNIVERFIMEALMMSVALMDFCLYAKCPVYIVFTNTNDYITT